MFSSFIKNAKTTAIFLSDDDFDTIFSKSVLTRAATLFYIILLGHIFQLLKILSVHIQISIEASVFPISYLSHLLLGIFHRYLSIKTCIEPRLCWFLSKITFKILSSQKCRDFTTKRTLCHDNTFKGPKIIKRDFYKETNTLWSI